MLNIEKESENTFCTVGILNTLKVKEGKSPKSNDNYVSIELTVRADQMDNSGKVRQNIVPYKLFSSQHKKDGTENGNYSRLKEYAKELVPLASVDKGQESYASKVSIIGKIKENTFVSKNGETVVGWNLDTNFINEKRPSDDEGATFIVTGVVVNKKRIKKDGEDTDKLIVTLCLVGYNGTANLVDFVCYGSKADYIEDHWNKGDTIKAVGFIVMSSDVIEIEEEMFDGTYVNKKTVSVREFVIDKGSKEALDEQYSYDKDDIKTILDKRKSNILAMEQNAKQSKVKATSEDLGF